MAYQALYQKYRSTTFDEVVGQEYVVTAVRNAVCQNKIGHAYLFCGPRGTGKTTMARLLAKAVNCEDREHAPCGKCASCLAAASGNHPDIVEINAANETSVESIRDLIDRSQLAPMQSRYKIYIIDEVHQLSSSASSALLKILEEPPTHVIFILATTEPLKLLPTIISRCQRFDFTKLSREQISSHLLDIAGKEKIQLNPEAADTIAIMADGGMRDALSILDQCAAYADGAITEKQINQIYGLTGVSEKTELLKDILTQDAEALLKKIQSLENSGTDLVRFTRDLAALLRDGVVWSYSPKTEFLQIADAKQAKEIASCASPSILLEMIQKLMQAETFYRSAVSVSDCFEITCLDLMNCMQKPEPVQKKKPHADTEKAAPVNPAPVQSEPEGPSPEPIQENMHAEKPEPPVSYMDTDLEKILQLLVQCNKNQRSEDEKKLEEIRNTPASVDNGRYLSVLKQTEVAASGSDCILLKCREQAAANMINETEFNRDLYFYLMDTIHADKMIYALTQDAFTEATRQFLERSRQNALPEALKIERWTRETEDKEKQQTPEEMVLNLFGNDVEIITEEKNENGHAETDGSGTADAEDAGKD